MVAIHSCHRGCIKGHEECGHTALQVTNRAKDEGGYIAALCRTQRVLPGESKTCRPEDLGTRLLHRLWKPPVWGLSRMVAADNLHGCGCDPCGLPGEYW